MLARGAADSLRALLQAVPQGHRAKWKGESRDHSLAQPPQPFRTSFGTTSSRELREGQLLQYLLTPSDKFCSTRATARYYFRYVSQQAYSRPWQAYTSCTHTSSPPKSAGYAVQPAHRAPAHGSPGKPHGCVRHLEMSWD